VSLDRKTNLIVVVCLVLDIEHRVLAPGVARDLHRSVNPDRGPSGTAKIFRLARRIENYNGKLDRDDGDQSGTRTDRDTVRVGGVRQRIIAVQCFLGHLASPTNGGMDGEIARRISKETVQVVHSGDDLCEGWRVAGKEEGSLLEHLQKHVSKHVCEGGNEQS
jgi:hypothetical protein